MFIMCSNCDTLRNYDGDVNVYVDVSKFCNLLEYSTDSICGYISSFFRPISSSIKRPVRPAPPPPSSPSTSPPTRPSSPTLMRPYVGGTEISLRPLKWGGIKADFSLVGAGIT